MALKYNRSGDGEDIVYVEVPQVVQSDGYAINKIMVDKCRGSVIHVVQDNDLIMLDLDSLDDFITALKVIKERGI